MGHKIAYSDAPRLHLEDLFEFRNVRTIPVECRKLPVGRSEWPIVISLDKESALWKAGVLPSMFENAMFIYCCVRGGEALRAVFGGHARREDGEQLRLNEYNEGFVLFVRQQDGTEKPIYLIGKEDVMEMMRRARHPNA